MSTPCIFLLFIDIDILKKIENRERFSPLFKLLGLVILIKLPRFNITSHFFRNKYKLYKLLRLIKTCKYFKLLIVHFQKIFCLAIERRPIESIWIVQTLNFSKSTHQKSNILNNIYFILKLNSDPKFILQSTKCTTVSQNVLICLSGITKVLVGQIVDEGNLNKVLYVTQDSAPDLPHFF